MMRFHRAWRRRVGHLQAGEVVEPSSDVVVDRYCVFQRPEQVFPVMSRPAARPIRRASYRGEPGSRVIGGLGAFIGTVR